MSPDFKSLTVSTLAERAAYLCSNPDCRVNTIGPNTNPIKSTKIGEAAHICGARPGSKRYRSDMNDLSRAAITNGIWLCRNCHKLIDTDEIKYSRTVLLRWREMHEDHVSSTIGNQTDRIINTERKHILEEFANYPPIIARIIIDKPDTWEYQLAAELLVHLNTPILRQLQDLNEGLFIKELYKVDDEHIFEWIQDRLVEMQRVIKPMEGLVNRLSKSWGSSGEPGDVEEIHHIAKLIMNYLQSVLSFEEKVQFVIVNAEFQKIVALLQNVIGSQAQKISEIPKALYEVCELVNSSENSEPITLQKVIRVELPEGWNEEFDAEITRLVTNGLI